MSTTELPAGLTDEQLMAQFVATQDSAYFVAVFERHRERITNYLAKRLRGDRHDAEDMAQEVFMRAFKHAKKSRGRPIIAWLLMIATNCAINRHKAQSATKRGGGEVPLSRVMSEPEHPPDREGSAENQAIGEEDRRQVRQLMATLSPIRQDVLREVYFSGLKLEEYAEKQGIALGTAASRLHRALEELRGLLLYEPIAARNIA